MNKTQLAKMLPAVVAVLGGGVILVWFFAGHGMELKERVPGMDRSGAEAGGGVAVVKWEGKLIKGDGVPANLNGVWPGFRGPKGDNICTDPTPLAKSWPEGGPKALWKIPVGEGYAAAAIWKGRVFVMDYDTAAKADALRCLSLADGKEIWRYTYPVKIKRNHGMSRTIPTVTEKCVVAIGPKCHVICVNTETGELRWKLDLVREFSTEVPPWYAGQCPLVDGDRVILGTGGDALVIAVDLMTGKLLWKSPNPRRWQMTHSSLTPVEFKGRRMYVYCASGGVAGVSATDGAILWSTPDWKITMANIPAPLYIGDGRIFLCGGYNAGSMMIQLRETGGKFAVETLFRLKPTVFGATQQTPILYQNHIIGVRPDGQLTCLDLNGKPVWTSGAASKFGSGPFLIAQGMIYLVNDHCVLTLGEVSAAGFKQLAQAKVLSGVDSWGPLALADGRLIVRDMTEMVCLDVMGK
ncbi:MAG: PQQ-like beta-propeller repeat protein [Verrucomicrobiae bacterium]|nr:PQQ-like beta-propeller repeat protein [Verrucomicrobiae bacterium]